MKLNFIFFRTNIDELVNEIIFEVPTLLESAKPQLKVLIKSKLFQFCFAFYRIHSMYNPILPILLFHIIYHISNNNVK